MADVIETNVDDTVVRGEFLERKVNHIAVAITAPFDNMKLERSWDGYRIWDYPDYLGAAGEDAAVELLRLMYEMNRRRDEMVEAYEEMQHAADDHWESTVVPFEAEYARLREDDRGLREAREAGRTVDWQTWSDELVSEKRGVYARAYARLRELERDLLYRHLGELANAAATDVLLEYVARWANSEPLPTERYREAYEEACALMTSIDIVESDR